MPYDPFFKRNVCPAPPPVSRVFQRVHTGPDSEIKAAQFRQKREELDQLRKRYEAWNKTLAT